MSIEFQMNPAEHGLLDTHAGIISDLKVQHVVQNVFWRRGDREGMAATGTIAAAFGLSGPAASMAMMSAEEMEERVTWVEFRLGAIKVKAMLWNWPFLEGDDVRVVGRHEDDGNFFALSVLQEQSRLIVSYPHVSAGTWAHWMTVAKYSLMFSVPWCALVIGFFWLVQLKDSVGRNEGGSVLVAQAYLVCVLLFCFIGYRMGRRFTRFAKMADAIFQTLGWPNAKRINLRRITKQKRQPGDHLALGDTYFRY